MTERCYRGWWIEAHPTRHPAVQRHVVVDPMGTVNHGSYATARVAEHAVDRALDGPTAEQPRSGMSGVLQGMAGRGRRKS